MDPAAAAERQAVLRGLADSLAGALAGGSALQEDCPASLLREALLAESEDASEAACGRCLRLRGDLATAAREALGRREGVKALVADALGDALPVRVEVRGTAGRSILSPAFTVGSSPHCDVQAVGDATVAPLQCVVVSLPGGVVVCDAWSGGRTSETWRGGERPQEPVLRPTAAAGSTVFFAAYGERVTLQIGAKTTITLATKPKKVPTATAPAKALLFASQKVVDDPKKSKLPCYSQVSTCSGSTTGGRLTSCSSRSRSRSARGSFASRDSLFRPPSLRCEPVRQAAY
jgi:hypothetical protein